MKVMCTKGTSEQFLNAVQDRIAELSGGSSIESSTNISVLDNMTLGAQIYWLYTIHGDGEIDYPAFEEEMRDQYNIEVAQTGYDGSFEDYIREVCEDEADQGFELPSNEEVLTWM